MKTILEELKQRIEEAKPKSDPGNTQHERRLSIGKRLGLSRAIKIVDEMIREIETVDNWTPVSQARPYKTGLYKVTRWDKMDGDVCYEVRESWFDAQKHKWSCKNVLAWKPLKQEEPYKPNIIDSWRVHFMNVFLRDSYE